MTEPFLSYVDGPAAVNWSAELEQLHEESSRDHPIDRLTRRAMLDRLGEPPPGATVLDLGCSSGYLLADLRRARPDAALVGIDLVSSGLRRAHELVPDARLLQADATDLPLEDGSVDAAVSANLLEHVPDDARVLAELRRVLRPGGRAVIVVPANPRLYDYYDRFLGHERRYARGELAGRATGQGLELLEDRYLGSLLYPGFWLVKQRNRRRRNHLDGEAAERQVQQDIATTGGPGLTAAACALEARLARAGVHLPFGVRELIVLGAP